MHTHRQVVMYGTGCWHRAGTSIKNSNYQLTYIHMTTNIRNVNARARCDPDTKKPSASIAALICDLRLVPK